MRFFSLTTLGLFGLAAAAPACPANQNLSSSKGVKLRVKLQDAGKDLAKPVQGQFITSIHDGAGTGLVGFSDDHGPTFYINGTGTDGLFWSTISDGGTPAAPYSLTLRTLDSNPDIQVVRHDVGKGDDDIYVPANDVHPQLRPTGWLACDEPLAYYGGKHFNVLRRSAVDKPAPEECVAVSVLPECATLEDLPKGALASHEFAHDVSCYKDVSKA